MSAEMITAIAACATLAVYITATVAGGVAVIFKKIEKTKTEILADVNLKHRENDMRWQATNALVIRHDTILDPDFNGNFGAKHRGR